MRKLITLLAALTLVAPLMFLGCSGDDGDAGPQGPQGNAGVPGPPGSGVVAEETCVLCHSAGQAFDVNNMHRLNSTTGNPVTQTPGVVDLAVTNVAFGTPVDNNVPVTVTFTFRAVSKDNVIITPNINLTTPGTADNLAWVSFYLAKMIPAAAAGNSDEWYGFLLTPGATGSSPYRTAVVDNVGGAVFTRAQNTPAAGTDTYTYTFRTGALRTTDGYDAGNDNVLMRVGVQFATGGPSALNTPLLNLFTTDTYYHTQSNRRPFANSFLDVVNGTGLPPAPGAFPFRNAVSTAACNACHDTLAIHGGGRHEVKFCQICHNPRIEVASHPTGGGYDNGALVKLIHGLHQGRNLGSRGSNTGPPPPGGRGIGDFSEVTYPQDIRNCTKCHQGPAAADNTYDNWKTRPTAFACGSCHNTISFVSPAPAGKTLHSGGAQATNAGCAGCHPATAIPGYHATENVTPNNPLLPGTLASFEYRIDNVTVDNNNVATIKFAILQNGALANLGNAGDNVSRPAGFTGGPSFLFAYALPQDGIAAPADYNNLGRTAGQPESLPIVGLPIVAKDNTSYTVTRANAFPAGAKMRAVALQGYFTQTSGGVGLDNVGRHTFSVVRPVTGDAVRRVAVESGYTNNNNPLTGQPTGCLECHEIFEGHGGNRVSNAQVCVMCHNPNLSSSGRTITASPINPAIVAKYGSDPLKYPEVANNFKELIHGIHGAAKRTTNFVDIRNRLNGVLLEGDEITYPGDLSHCGKCHLNNLYQNIQTTDRLLTTVQTTSGKANEVLADITAARASVPNATDLVNTPAASACGHCHDSVTARSHFVAMGGEVRAPRGSAVLTPPSLAPDVTP